VFAPFSKNYINAQAIGNETNAKIIVKKTGDYISFLYGSIFVIKK